MSVIIRLASREDIEAFSEQPNKPTVKAWLAEKDGRIIALFGLSLQRGRWVVFCDLLEEARNYKMTIMRCGKRLMSEARAMNLRYVYAEADANEPGAVKWLQSLGFELDPRSAVLYRWEP